MGSTRLPGKVMMNADGQNPMLYYVINQVLSCKKIDKIVVATTILKQDDVIVKFVKSMNLEIFRGSSEDVLDRYYKCAKKFGFSAIVRITADCPLIDPEIVDEVIDKFDPDLYNYVSNIFPQRSYPYGTEVEIFSFTALKNAWEKAEYQPEREHVTIFIRNNADKKILNHEYTQNISHLRWTVDMVEDLDLVRAIIAKIKKRPILMKDILLLISKEPYLLNINKNIKQKIVS